MSSSDQILRKLKSRKAKLNFFYFCSLLIPDFYKADRNHLVNLCSMLQELAEDKLMKEGKPVHKLMVNMPPRHGKSLTLQLFTMWLLGRNPQNSVMTICYNQLLSSRFSKAVRNNIEGTRADESFVFSDVFPEVVVKQGDASASLWSLEGSHFSYLGGSFGSTLTGLGCSWGIIDDPIKNSMDANNERVLEEQYQFYTDTFLSRVEEGGKQIINMTRWSDSDLCGRLLEEEGDSWFVYEFKAFNEESGEMLCPELMSYETYLDKKSKMSEEIFLANYQQTPINIQGALYQRFETYISAPQGVKKCYIDTADKGSDYLCALFYTESSEAIFLQDVVYTRKPMEITEALVTEAILRNETTEVKIESNNGGRGFGRNVEKFVQERGYHSATFNLFTQTENKEARILSRSADVQRLVYYPEDWSMKWPDFQKDVKKYQRSGKNKHDDAVDCLTGIVESFNAQTIFVY